MGLFDKAKHKVEDAAGKAKEAAGDISGDDSKKFEGKADQAKASAKDKAEDAHEYLED
ncbi:CsbD family protein [Flexivirga caeni]|uniref:CsbD family protein n=1 Tax=Flexivirga caeni TaxID=2294115 RepID=A0A3M9MCM3_9MICO|nr:CsbD family protein [Flexivirga caeni]RNI22907.1 CsbD family protein [Flexivirga caeni]